MILSPAPLSLVDIRGGKAMQTKRRPRGRRRDGLVIAAGAAGDRLRLSIVADPKAGVERRATRNAIGALVAC